MADEPNAEEIRSMAVDALRVALRLGDVRGAMAIVLTSLLAPARHEPELMGIYDEPPPCGCPYGYAESRGLAIKETFHVCGDYKALLAEASAFIAAYEAGREPPPLSDALRDYVRNAEPRAAERPGETDPKP